MCLIVSLFPEGYSASQEKGTSGDSLKGGREGRREGNDKGFLMYVSAHVQVHGNRKFYMCVVLFHLGELYTGVCTPPSSVPMETFAYYCTSKGHYVQLNMCIGTCVLYTCTCT